MQKPLEAEELIQRSWEDIALGQGEGGRSVDKCTDEMGNGSGVRKEI